MTSVFSSLINQQLAGSSTTLWIQCTHQNCRARAKLDFKLLTVTDTQLFTSILKEILAGPFTRVAALKFKNSLQLVIYLPFS